MDGLVNEGWILGAGIIQNDKPQVATRTTTTDLPLAGCAEKKVYASKVDQKYLRRKYIDKSQFYFKQPAFGVCSNIAIFC